MLTQKQQTAYDTYYANNCSETATSKALGVSVTVLRKRLYYCARKGHQITPSTFCSDLPAGFGVTKTTIQRRLNKETGQLEVVGDWPRGAPLEQNSEQLFSYLKTRIPSSPIGIKKPLRVDPDIQLEWTLADIHYGMLAWRKETGEDYDIKIARSLILDTASDIFARSGKVKETVLVLMGDNFHTDFYSGLTEQSKTSLDVDSRFPKMIKTGIETFISAIEICLQFSESVKVIVLYGNHDKQTSTILPLILDINFKNEPRVNVDLSPSKAHYNYWGSVATMYHHGDKTTKARLCSDFALHCARTAHNNNRGPFEYFYVKQGHLHKELIEDVNGVTFEIVPSPIAKEQYAAAANYSNKRATVATAYHKQAGEVFRYSITPQALKLKRDK